MCCVLAAFSETCDLVSSMTLSGCLELVDEQLIPWLELG